MIKDFTPRRYQEAIAGSVAKRNTLVVLPTGLGKTNIFLMAAANRLKQHPESKILLIGPTRPLIDQYFEVFRRHFDVDEALMVILTGSVRPENRVKLWQQARIIFSTPQGLENDVLTGKISLREVSLVGFDEAHRAVGNYSYVWLAGKYEAEARYPRIIGLTASPGSDLEKITEVCNSLKIEEIEARTESDSDVRPYVQQVEVEHVKVSLPDSFMDVSRDIQLCINSKLQAIKHYGHLSSSVGTTKGELLKLQASLHARMKGSYRDFTVMKSVSLLAEVMKAGHALELLETQGIAPLQSYFSRLVEEGRTTKVRALKNLLADRNFRAAMVKVQRLYNEKIDHPKLEELKKLISGEVGNGVEKVIVFNQYRDSALKIKEELDGLPGIKSEIFVGQAKKANTGLSQKDQKKMLDRFRAGEFNVLVATSIGEEGLDIVKVDLVVFYEPVPSAIRSIQRRGRTGRGESGRVVILLAVNTRDEAFRWIAHRKEKKMHDVLKTLKSRIKLGSGKKASTGGHVSEESRVKIVVDHREKGPIARELSSRGADVELRPLSAGDYLCSSRVAVEVKSVGDFVDSIVDRRLLQQANRLKAYYERPVILIEGEEDVYSVRGVHPNAIQGMLASIAVDLGIPVLKTRDFRETAGLLLAMSRREQGRKNGEIQLHAQKPATLKEQQEYLVSAFPGIESVTAKSLLRNFGTVSGIVNADEDALRKASLIGPKKAAEIKKVVDSEYNAEGPA